MTKKEMLNGMSEEQFYSLYPTEEHYKKAKGGTPEAFPQQPDSKEFFNPGWMPNVPDYFYAMGGNPPCHDCEEGLYQAYNGTSIPSAGNQFGATSNVDLTKKVNLNQNPNQIPQNANAAGWNAFQGYLQKQNMVNDPRMNTPEGRKALTDQSVQGFNKSDYVTKYPQNAITPDNIKAAQQYHKQSDPNVQVDQWVGSQTSQLKYPTPTRYFQTDQSKVTPQDKQGFVPVTWGNQRYVQDASKPYSQKDLVPYDEKLHGATLQKNYIPKNWNSWGQPQAKSGWIQKATANMRQDHPCTGSKFGSSSCPPGSKAYNLAKTFRAMAKKAGGGETDDGTSEEDFIAKYNNDFMQGIKDNVWRSVADDTMQEFMPNEHEPDMDVDDQARYGMFMQMGGMNLGTGSGFNPNLNNQQMFAQRADQLQQQGTQAFQNFAAAGQDAINTSDPHMQWNMPKALQGMFLQSGGTGHSFQDYFPTNSSPHMKWKWNTTDPQPVRAQDPEQDSSGEDPYRFGNYSQQDLHKLGNTASSKSKTPAGNDMRSYLTSYEAKKRFFGSGARYIKATFRSPYDLPGQLPMKDYHFGTNSPVPDTDLSPSFPGAERTDGPRAMNYGGIHKFLPKGQMGVDMMSMRNPSLVQPMQPMELQQMQPMQGYKDTTVEGKYKAGINGEAGANWLMAGMEGLTSVLNQGDQRNARDRMKSLQGADANFAATQAGNRGTYGQTGAYNGVFNPYNMTPVQQPGQNFGQMGSNNIYQEGGEYMMDDEDIQQFLAMGGTIQYLD